ncbi:hypothetical protein FRB99_004845 [Tulasnella sp. 403]|nr:hypothetical protein FRB99_004845 [Tulasnella sp. 403]
MDKGAKSGIKELEKQLATALIALKPFRINKSWIHLKKKNSEIGVGGYGVVYRAVFQKHLFATKTVVAVKKLHTIGDWEKLLRVALALVQELDVWAKLDHPNILPLRGFHLSSGLDEAWLVSPYAPNGNIFEYLERTNLGLDERLELAKDTAKGLEYLHTRTPPICHGDIKALNILINALGRAMLCDFGLAKATDASVTKEQTTTSANTGGTVRYWSSELFDSGAQPTLESDVWAWGCLLLEITTGQPPYHDTILEGRLIYEISGGKLPAAVDGLECPPHVQDLLSKCWNLTPEARPTMTESLAALTAGNIKLYRSETLNTSSSVTTTYLDSMEREFTDLLSSLEKYRVDPGWFDFPKLGSAIGVGGFGVVHKVAMRISWRSRPVVVAVKKLRTMGGREKRLRMVTALIRELNVWAGLYHTNILPLIGYHLSPQLDEAWLVSPYVTNGNLCQFILQFMPSEKEQLRLALDTADGLQYLHTREPPVCHGDIKSLNILINSERRAILCDFGLAKTMESMPSGLTTSTFNQAGSLPYESPELLLGTSQRALESDIWAWGCVLQEVCLYTVLKSYLQTLFIQIFTGKGPYYWAINPGAIVKWIIQSIPPAVLTDISCPRNVHRLLRCCWQISSSLRPTISECVAVLSDEIYPVNEGSEDDPSRETGDSILDRLEERSATNALVYSRIKRSDLVFEEASKIGSGAYGVVYEGTLVAGPSALVAIKRLYRPGRTGGATATAAEPVQWLAPLLNHEHVNVLRILGYSIDDAAGGEFLLVYPFVRSGNLETYLHQQTPDPQRRLQLATDIAQGLLFLHTRSPPVCHGALHPRNVLIDEHGSPLLSDYGLATTLYVIDIRPASLDTLCYSSPEVVLESSPPTLRSDLWSWACILLLLVTGRTPYDAGDIHDTASLARQLRLHALPASLDDIDCPHLVQNLLGLCWREEAEARIPLSEVVAILSGKTFKFEPAFKIRRSSDFPRGVQGVRFSPRGEFLTISVPGKIRVYETKAGEFLYNLNMPNSGPDEEDEDAAGGGDDTLAFSPSARLLACSHGKDILIFDLDKRQLKETLSGHGGDLRSIDLSSDDALCASGSENHEARLWYIGGQRQGWCINFDNEVNAIAIPPGCDVVAVGLFSVGIRILDVRNGGILATSTPDVRWMWALRYSPDGRRLFGACGDSSVKCWESSELVASKKRENGVPCKTFARHRTIVSSVSGNGPWVAAISDNGEVRMVNIDSGASTSIGQIPSNSAVSELDLGPVSDKATGLAISNGREGDYLTICTRIILAALAHAPQSVGSAIVREIDISRVFFAPTSIAAVELGVAAACEQCGEFAQEQGSKYCGRNCTALALSTAPVPGHNDKRIPRPPKLPLKPHSAYQVSFGEFNGKPSFMLRSKRGVEWCNVPHALGNICQRPNAYSDILDFSLGTGGRYYIVYMDGKQVKMATSPNLWEELNEDFHGGSIRQIQFGAAGTVWGLKSYRKYLPDDEPEQLSPEQMRSSRHRDMLGVPGDDGPRRHRASSTHGRGSSDSGHQGAGRLDMPVPAPYLHPGPSTSRPDLRTNDDDYDTPQGFRGLGHHKAYSTSNLAARYAEEEDSALGQNRGAGSRLHRPPQPRIFTSPATTDANGAYTVQDEPFGTIPDSMVARTVELYPELKHYGEVDFVAVGKGGSWVIGVTGSLCFWDKLGPKIVQRLARMYSEGGGLRNVVLSPSDTSTYFIEGADGRVNYHVPDDWYPRIKDHFNSGNALEFTSAPRVHRPIAKPSQHQGGAGPSNSGFGRGAQLRPQHTGGSFNSVSSRGSHHKHGPHGHHGQRPHKNHQNHGHHGRPPYGPPQFGPPPPGYGYYPPPNVYVPPPQYQQADPNQWNSLSTGVLGGASNSDLTAGKDVVVAMLQAAPAVLSAGVQVATLAGAAGCTIM